MLLVNNGLEVNKSVNKSTECINKQIFIKTSYQKYRLNKFFYFRQAKQQPTKLEHSQIWVTSVPPKETVCYTKETQTVVQANDSEGNSFVVLHE